MNENPYQSPEAADDSTANDDQRGRASGVRLTVLLVLSGTLGAVIWACSPWLSGEQEAFDAPGYYNTALFLCGFIAAAPCAQRFYLAPIGMWVGQIAYCIAMLPAGPLWIIGAAVMLLNTLFTATSGAALAGGIISGLRR